MLAGQYLLVTVRGMRRVLGRFRYTQLVSVV